MTFSSYSADRRFKKEGKSGREAQDCAEGKKTAVKFFYFVLLFLYVSFFLLHGRKPRIENPALRNRVMKKWRKAEEKEGKKIEEKKKEMEEGAVKEKE